jgi:hypothetical protein
MDSRVTTDVTSAEAGDVGQRARWRIAYRLLPFVLGGLSETDESVERNHRKRFFRTGMIL